MGFFSKDCHGCGHPALCEHAINAINAWMKDVVAVLPEGGMVQGTYDGYGHVGEGDCLFGCGSGQPVLAGPVTVWHKACWERAGKPTDYKGDSTWSADQGWWFGTEHDMPEPVNAES